MPIELSRKVKGQDILTAFRGAVASSGEWRARGYPVVYSRGSQSIENYEYYAAPKNGQEPKESKTRIHLLPLSPDEEYTSVHLELYHECASIFRNGSAYVVHDPNDPKFLSFLPAYEKIVAEFLKALS